MGAKDGAGREILKAMQERLAWELDFEAKIDRHYAVLEALGAKAKEGA